LFEYFIHNSGFNFNQATFYILPRLQQQILKEELYPTKFENNKKTNLCLKAW